jgi:YidC/Oxa1 family membrane protein insertase
MPTVLLGENSLFHEIGEIFHPIFVLFATILAFIYGIVPNYALSIILLTIVVMAVLTPLTIKSTKSMLLMQELQPEVKKLQQKYKGAENREQLNQEMMRLYKEKGINPAGGCLPFLIQFPFLIVLYDVIRGLTNMTPATKGHPSRPAPEYISHSSRLYKDLVHSGGHMYSFGMDLAAKPFSHHSSPAAYIPYFVLVIVAIGLQYFQMAQMTRRNPGAAQANKQMQTMQKFMPILFAYIYLIVPAAVVVYMVVSTIIRIATQDIIFRTGIVPAPAGQRRLPAETSDAPAGAAALGAAPGPFARLREAREARDAQRSAEAGSGAKAASGSDGGGTASARGNGQAVRGQGRGQSQRAGQRAGSRNGKAGARRTPAGSVTGKADGSGGGAEAKPHPRSKSKRERKAR